MSLSSRSREILIIFCLSVQVSDQTDENKNALEEICEESGIEIEECEAEIIQESSLDNLIEETALIRRKSLRTAERKSLVVEDSAQEPIEEEEEEEKEKEEEEEEEEEYDENWVEESIAYTEYKELVRLIEDHVIMPFDVAEWASESLEVTWLTRKETAV